MSTHVLELVQEHVRTYMLAGRGEELLAALRNHGNPVVCKTCRVPAETIETCTIFQKICRQNDPRFGVRF